MNPANCLTQGHISALKPLLHGGPEQAEEENQQGAS